MNKTSQYDFTIIVPVFNEQDNMNRLEQTLSSYLGTSPVKTCVLFVDDGSTDASAARIREACSRNDGFFYLLLKRNGGLSQALKAGIDQVYSPYVGYIDADLQTSPEDFNLLLPYISQYELVTGIRSGRKDSRIKNLSSRIANRFRRSMTGDDAQDTGCPLKILHTDSARRIPFFKGMHRFIPALILLQQGRFKQVPVRHFPRIAGESKYNLWNRLRGPLVDCFAYRWMKKRYIHYSVKESTL